MIFFSLNSTTNTRFQPQTKQLLLKPFCDWLQIRSSPMFWSYYYINADLHSTVKPRSKEPQSKEKPRSKENLKKNLTLNFD